MSDRPPTKTDQEQAVLEAMMKHIDTQDIFSPILGVHLVNRGHAAMHLTAWDGTYMVTVEKISHAGVVGR